MGMQGPLTAQALGRSPYDDVVEGEGEEDPREPTQQYDHGGRPINPNTMRINRDIIRSHNQVMLVIGVAEPENPTSGSEADSYLRHQEYEESIGLKFVSSAKRCLEAVGIFGVNGFRERILIYKRYSEIPFWDIYQQTRRDFSFSRDILPGAPAAFLANYIEHLAGQLWLGEEDKMTVRRWIHRIWGYTRVHLELYVAMQRLGLIPTHHWFPNPLYFIPFTEASPIPAPPPLETLSPPSILRWLGGFFISTTPFFVWYMTQRTIGDWKPQIWAQIYKRLPNTAFRCKTIPPAPPSIPQSSMNEAPGEPHGTDDGSSPRLASADSQLLSDAGTAETARRPSIFSSRGDDYASDEDENEGVRATLISFDVEATESTDAPPGLWSAELRPSLASDSRAFVGLQPTYLDTLLTELPALIASHIFTNVASRILMTPYEATALRLAARTYRSRHGLPCDDIFHVNLLSGLSWTWCINYLGTELLNLILSGEVWAVFTSISQWFHMSEEEWKMENGKNQRRQQQQQQQQQH